MMKPLYMDFMEDFVFLDRTHTNDGYGGTITTWTDGAAFQAALVLDTSSEVVAAQAAGAKNIYRVSVGPSVRLEYHDVFKRISDNKVFRVTSDGDDKHTPNRATFQISQVTAEEYTPEAVTT